MNISRMFVNTVTVKTYLGINGGSGVAKFADPPVDVKVWLQDGNKLVRDSEGAEVVSSASVYGPLGSADLFVPRSVVTANGRSSTVIALSRFDATGLVGGANHFRAELT